MTADKPDPAGNVIPAETVEAARLKKLAEKLWDEGSPIIRMSEALRLHFAQKRLERGKK